MSKEEIKAQFDSVVEQLNGELSTLPESVSPLVNLLIATFNMLFEITANQTDNLKVSINSLKQTIEQQTQTIENLTRSNQKLGSVNILMGLFKKYSIDARYHLCLIIVVELIVATFLGCLEVCLRTLARSL